MKAFNPSKHVEEKERFGFDFVKVIPAHAGQIVGTPEWDITVLNGKDDDPGDMKVGTPIVDGTEVWQTLEGGVKGVRYRCTCTVTTANAPNERFTLQGDLYVIA